MIVTIQGAERIWDWHTFEELTTDHALWIAKIEELLTEGFTPARVEALMRNELALSDREAYSCRCAARHAAYLKKLTARTIPE
jgi:hypothetical protein